MKIRMIGLSMISFAIAIASCVIALKMDTGKKPEPDPEPTPSSAVSQPQASSQTSSMRSNGPANLRLIDISHYEDVTDWKAVKSKIDGVYMKATESTTYTDEKLSTYAAAAIKEKIPVGFYHYFWPSQNLDYAKQQANYFYNAIKGYNYQLYPVLDVEETNKQPDSVVIASVKTFAVEFERLSGHPVMIYCSQNFANRYLSDASLKSYKLWIAHYDVNAPGNTTTWDRYVMWQYNDKENIAGIKGMVDGDVATTNVFINESIIDE